MSRSLPQISCTFDRLPANLPGDRRYVSWRYEQRHDQLTKVPLEPGQSQRRASVTTSATWGSFADARADVEQRRVHRLGLTGDITVVDLDARVDLGRGAVITFATRVLEQLPSYSELSPSATRLHILGHGSLPPGRRRIRGLEAYDNRWLITLTGARVAGTPCELVELTSVLSVLHLQLFPRQPQVSRVPASRHCPVMTTRWLRLPWPPGTAEVLRPLGRPHRTVSLGLRSRCGPRRLPRLLVHSHSRTCGRLVSPDRLVPPLEVAQPTWRQHVRLADGLVLPAQ